MKNPKVGDRVVVYGTISCCSSTGTCNHHYSKGIKGTVTGIIDPDLLVVYVGGCGKSEVHPKQCRRLKTKIPLRRLYVPRLDMSYEVSGLCICKTPSELNSFLEIEAKGDPRFVEFVEVRRK